MVNVTRDGIIFKIKLNQIYFTDQLSSSDQLSFVYKTQVPVDDNLWIQIDILYNTWN
jgi:hypothetical protein